jgi:GT2 family glycosyltransferase
VAKKVKFDENFFWSWESDFGYRLTKKGKMRYVPKAVVYHYHRSTWKGFFKQQLNNGKATPLLFLTKRKEGIEEDNISTIAMGLRLGLFTFFIILMFFGLFFKQLLFPSGLFLTLFIFLTIKDSIKLSKDFSDFIYYIGIFLIRTTAWALGILWGIFYLLLKRIKN